MADAFSSVWQKIKWAKKHTDNLESEILAFWEVKPYEIETQGNPQAGAGSYRIKGTPKPLPESISLIAGDATHNLRCALDHFACRAVTKVTDDTAFPVWRVNRTPTRVEWSGLVKGKLKGASPRLIKAVSALKAYKAGNGEYVWAVNELDRIDKHRLPLYIPVTNTAVIIDFGESMGKLLPGRIVPSLPLALKPQWTPIEDGTVLFVNQSGSDLNTEPKFTFDVTLGEPEVLKGESVVPALRRLIDEVEGLLKRLVPLV